MKLYAVHDYLISIEGNQSEGWRASDSQTSRKVLFTIEIEEQANEGGFLLLIYSRNDEIYTDTWHESIREAMNVAEEEYKVPKSLWRKIK